MINLNTSSDELWHVLIEEHDKAIYWMKKCFGGEKRYEQMRDNLLIRCTKLRKPLASETVEYISKEGNRWICFEQATYYPESNGSFCLPVALCYYETAASIGVFSIGYLHVNGLDKPDAIFIYTPHFFQRYAERMNIKGKANDLLMSFIGMTPSFVPSPVSINEDGRKMMDIRIPGCICRGIMRKDNRNVYEVRTILSDQQLSNKQLRETENTRKIGDVIKFEPDDLRQSRLRKSDNSFLTWFEEIKKIESLGLDMTLTKEAYGLNLIITEAFFKMGVADRNDNEFWEKYNTQHKVLLDIFQRRKKEEGDSFDYMSELVKLARDIAARIGIRKFNWHEFEHIVNAK